MAQLFHASRLELPKFKLICESVKDTILAKGQLDEELLLDSLGVEDEIFDIDDARACFAAVDYIMSNACQHQVTRDMLAIELEQLGLPSEHCQLLCQMMNDSLDEIKEHLL